MTGYRLLLSVNVAAMAAAVIMLVFLPEALGRLMDRPLSDGGLIVARLLGASEAAFATLCLFGIRANDQQNMRMISITCIVLHAASAVALIAAWRGGTHMVALLDVAFRLVMIGLFVWLGICNLQAHRPGGTAAGPGTK